MNLSFQYKVALLCSEYGVFSIGQIMPLDGGYAAM